MLARKPENLDQIAKDFPVDRLQEAEELLNKVYKDKCAEQGRSFKVFGQIFPTEIVFITSFLSHDVSVPPISCFISKDILKDQRQENILKEILDFSGHILDHVFLELNNESEEGVYSVNWQEFTEGKKVFHFKITRENVELTIQANQLLNQ